MARQIIILDGQEYYADGDYPNGRYALHPKEKGTEEKNKTKIKRLTKVDINTIDWDAIQTTDTGKVITAILCGLFDTNLNKLKD